MKYLIITIIALCTSCQSAAFKNVYTNATVSEFRDAEAKELGSVPGIEVGIQYGDGSPGHAVGIVSDIALRVQLKDATVDDVSISYDTLGVRTGLRYYPDTGTRLAQPYVAAGVLWQYTRLKSDLDAEDDTGKGNLAFIGMVGIESQVTDGLRLHLGYSITSGLEPDVDGEEFDLDSGTLLFGVGWSF